MKASGWYETSTGTSEFCTERDEDEKHPKLVRKKWLWNRRSSINGWLQASWHLLKFGHSN